MNHRHHKGAHLRPTARIRRDATLYADASWGHRSGKGGWAVWIASDAGRIIRAGPCPAYCSDANDAELVAIFAGLHLIATHWPTYRTVLVRSDSQDALNRLRRPSPPRRPAMQPLAAKLEDLLGRFEDVQPFWVRGHQGTGTRPGYVNDKVDELSRQARFHAEVGKTKSLHPCGLHMHNTAHGAARCRERRGHPRAQEGRS